MSNDIKNNEDLNEFSHKPVMLAEALEYLNLEPGKVIVDCTVGYGGHSSEILKKVTPGGFLIGIDKDEEVLRKTYESFLATAKENAVTTEREEENNFSFYQTDFENIEETIKKAGKVRVDGVLLDLGVSSIQLDSPERGFSFNREGPLDMRMDRSASITAYDILKKISLEELERVIRVYGEERWARRIARAVIEQRSEFGCPKTTTELSRLIKSTVPFSRKKIHPATLTFQALRIVVNKELESLENFLNNVHNLLNEGGRVVVISFHSLEDRIVKNVFRDRAKENVFKILTPKPVKASEIEVNGNPRSRSAKLRTAERMVA